MLIKSIQSIIPELTVDNTANNPQGETCKQQAVSLITDCENGSSSVFVAEADKSLTKAIGQLQNGLTTHFYSWGNFNLVRLMMYILKQIGPAHAFMTSYSFSQKSIEQLNLKLSQKQLLSFRVIIDNRVKTMSPIPFQMLMNSFDYRCTSIHAKIALIWNEDWKITILTSQNATDNPKMERGTIFTDSSVFDFDLKTLENEFLRGTT
ncbi:MAG TPA: hypothetical protein DCR40_14035 [Prolixibacteraceae bacterium]|nr:hypothetical protein [Prolixibacteraceae bacterium]